MQWSPTGELKNARWLPRAYLLIGELEFGRRMPLEAHLDAVGDTAGVRPDPGLVRVEDDPDLTRPVAGLGAGRLAIVKPPSVAGNERAVVADPVANRL
jgi:hypothetical protein